MNELAEIRSGLSALRESKLELTASNAAMRQELDELTVTDSPVSRRHLLSRLR